MPQPRYVTRLEQVPQLSQQERARLQDVCRAYLFRTNEYYLSLINWDDPADPLRRVVLPHEGELQSWGRPDPSDENDYMPVPGLQHKYPETALLLVSNCCGSFCRYCFRKRLFTPHNDEVRRDVSAAADYIARHPEITSVLVSGGDPLMLSTNRLRAVLAPLRQLAQVTTLRIGTKLLAYNPYRILHDADLPVLLRECREDGLQVYAQSHYNHPRELTGESRAALATLHDAGVVVTAHIPLIHGVNDHATTLATLFNELAACGVVPYYVFQCRPAQGNRPYTGSVEKNYDIFRTAQARCSGLGRTARFVMSHATGKIEVVGMTEPYIFMRYHQAVAAADRGRFLTFRRNSAALWLDDYQPQVSSAVAGATSHQDSASPGP